MGRRRVTKTPDQRQTMQAETDALRAESDEALMLRVAAGDRAAFIVIFERYAGRINGFLIRAGAEPGLAEEAAQEVMVTLWRRAALFDPERGSATTWIFTLARNKRVDLIRRAARAAPDADEPSFQADPIESAEASLANAARDRAVREAVAALGPDQKEAVRLAFFSGLSHSEIAERLDLPVGTVKSRLRLAFGKLREALGTDFAMELKDD